MNFYTFFALNQLLKAVKIWWFIDLFIKYSRGLSSPDVIKKKKCKNIQLKGKNEVATKRTGFIQDQMAKLALRSSHIRIPIGLDTSVPVISSDKLV